MSAPVDRRGQVAVITGAASGIGRGLARVAHARGMHLVLADRDRAALAPLAAELAGETLAVTHDVTDAEGWQRLAKRSYASFGRVDLLFNNAGVMRTGLSWQLAEEDWRAVLDVNVLGAVHGIRAFLPRMLAAGEPACIVNTASVGGFLSSPYMAPYCASKFALVALTESLRAELELLAAPVRAALLAPGPVCTEIFGAPFGTQPDAGTQAFVARMRELTDQYGLTPEALAERAFAELDAGRFWLIPQAEALDDGLRERTASVLERRTPQLPWAVEA